MKINFIGSSGSGKTTTAAMVFARLKNLGIASEFVTEQARLYISEVRYSSKNQGNILLNDEDQLLIMTRQLKSEITVEYSVNGIGNIICDSSPLNALFYMSPEFRNDPRVKALVNKTLESTGTVFYCEPVLDLSILDPNRIHSAEESARIDKNIFAVLQDVCPEYAKKIKYLKGDPEARCSKVVQALVAF